MRLREDSEGKGREKVKDVKLLNEDLRVNVAFLIHFWSSTFSVCGLHTSLFLFTSFSCPAPEPNLGVFCFSLFVSMCILLHFYVFLQKKDPTVYVYIIYRIHIWVSSILFYSKFYFDHMIFSKSSSGSTICSMANFRRAWTCTGLSRGTRLELQYLSPSRCSVLLMVAFVTLVPALCRSFIRSLDVVLGFLLTILMIILTPRVEILRGAPDRGRLSVLLYVFH